jgi:hypothetical protein
MDTIINNLYVFSYFEGERKGIGGYLGTTRKK